MKEISKLDAWRNYDIKITIKELPKSRIAYFRNIKICTLLRYVRRITSYLNFSDSWLFCAYGLDVFQPRYGIV